MTISSRTSSIAKIYDDLFIQTVIIFSFFYTWYRYPFQISSSGTSPNYTDTPQILQIGKFVIFLGLILWRFIFYISQKPTQVFITKSHVLLGIAATYLCVNPFIYVDDLPSIEQSSSALFWFFIPATIFFTNKYATSSNIDFNSIISLINKIFLISVVFFVTEILLFVTIGRLPALSYSDSILVRFGGIWDDPNGFSVFVSFFIPLAFFGMHGTLQTILAVFSSAALLIGTQSGTGIIAGALAFFITCILCFSYDRPSVTYVRSVLIPLIGVVVISCIVVAVPTLRESVIDIVTVLLELKADSIDEHAAGIRIVSELTFVTAVGFAPINEIGESAYANWLTNFGFQYVTVFLLVALYFLVNSVHTLRISTNPSKRLFLQCTICFHISFLLSLINLPLDKVFPVNLLYIVFGIVPVLDRNHL